MYNSAGNNNQCNKIGLINKKIKWKWISHKKELGPMYQKLNKWIQHSQTKN